MHETKSLNYFQSVGVGMYELRYICNGGYRSNVVIEAQTTMFS